MSLSVSKRMARVKPSPTGAVLALATRLKAEGRDIISLGAGEPDFDTPEHIKFAAAEAIRAGDTKYTPTDGTAELKTAITEKFRRDNQLDFQPSQILVSSGAKQSLFNLCLTLLDDGDEAIVPAPYWVSYPDMVRLAGAEPVFLNTGIGAGFKITADQLRGAITANTRLLFLNSPSNPTGSSYSRNELMALGSVLTEYPNIVIVSDDIYEAILWSPEPFCNLAMACPELADRIVVVNGVSKSHAMTGWRIGYAAGPPDLIDGMKTIQSQSTSNPCSISQKAAVAALTGDQEPVRQMAQAYEERHAFFVPALNALPGVQCLNGHGTFYAFPRIEDAIQHTGVASDTEFARFLLETVDLAIVPGSAFGAQGYMRLSFASSMEHLAEAINRLKQALTA